MLLLNCALKLVEELSQYMIRYKLRRWQSQKEIRDALQLAMLNRVYKEIEISKHQRTHTEMQ